jgi:two-component sensor histidine kinase
VLLISELAANACAHSGSSRPGGSFTVRAELCHVGSLYVEVEDQGSEWDGNISAAKPPHGLFLLRELSDDCGARRGKQGWITWFTIAIPASQRQELRSALDMLIKAADAASESPPSRPAN